MKGWSIGKTKFLKPVIKSIENHSEACLNRNPKLLLKVSFLTLSESQTSNKNAQISDHPGPSLVRVVRLVTLGASVPAASTAVARSLSVANAQ